MSDVEQAMCDAGLSLLRYAGDRRFATVLADPPWRFANRTGKMAPEHKRLSRYETLSVDEIAALPVGQIAAERSHLYLWVPNALLQEGLHVMERWGYTYKTNIVWSKIRKDGGPDGRGVGFYFRNVTELVLFGIRGTNNRTLPPGRRQVNIISSRKRRHSHKPDELYHIIESCSPLPRLELFARHARDEWHQWGDEMRVVTAGMLSPSSSSTDRDNPACACPVSGTIEERTC
jgi:N6-adenosine-specific RNA methylase IME4